jgi:hypothetical protein
VTPTAISPRDHRETGLADLDRQRIGLPEPRLPPSMPVAVFVGRQRPTHAAAVSAPACSTTQASSKPVELLLR